MVDSATWLITGGQDTNGLTLDSSEVYQNGVFQPGPALPSPRQEHCQVTLNSSFVGMLGGYNGTHWLNDFNILNLETEEWVSMPDIAEALGDDPCGLIENSASGIELVVLVDYDSCYIFNFNDMTWREGPDIPYDVQLSWDSMLVQMEKTFYLLGGHIEGDMDTDAIFKFDNENYAWHMEATGLETAKGGGVAMAIPDEMANCS